MKRTTTTIDATNRAPGRVATEVATLLIGKHKPTYQPNIDAGDVVVVQNVSQMTVTGKKMKQKIYYKHTGYPGNLKKKTLGKLWEESPAKVLEKAVRNMLPKNKLRNERLKRLQIV